MNKKRYAMSFELKDGRKLIVRQPEIETDQERMMGFFAELPRDRRNYLRYNVTNPELLKRRLSIVDEQDHWRLIAEVDGKIVGDGSMDREPLGWSHHIADVRIVVAPYEIGTGIGTER